MVIDEDQRLVFDFWKCDEDLRVWRNEVCMGESRLH